MNKGIQTTLTATVFILLFLAYTEKGFGADPWPGEPWTSAKKLTHLDPHFRNNMSGACWNPETRTFWVCCNGGPSAFWALREDVSKSLMIAKNNSGKLAKYNVGKGDLEGICQADYKTDLVYLMLEGADLIKEYDVSTYGKAVLKNQWSISKYVPTKGGSGSEGITFVPNEWLEKEGFTDAEGHPYISKNGMGGLMLVAHQNGGRVYAFDLNPATKAVDFVGAYRTSRPESSGLEFDRSTGLLYVWHNTGPNYLEVARLASIVKGSERHFTTIAEFKGPKGGNLEGIAIVPTKTKDKWCLIVDDDNQNEAALMWFKEFNPTKRFKK